MLLAIGPFQLLLFILPLALIAVVIILLVSQSNLKRRVTMLEQAMRDLQNRL